MSDEPKKIPTPRPYWWNKEARNGWGAWCSYRGYWTQPEADADGKVPDPTFVNLRTAGGKPRKDLVWGPVEAHDETGSPAGYLYDVKHPLIDEDGDAIPGFYMAAGVMTGEAGEEEGYKGQYEKTLVPQLNADGEVIFRMRRWGDCPDESGGKATDSMNIPRFIKDWNKLTHWNQEDRKGLAFRKRYWFFSGTSLRAFVKELRLALKAGGLDATALKDLPGKRTKRKRKPYAPTAAWVKANQKSLLKALKGD